MSRNHLNAILAVGITLLANSTGVVSARDAVDFERDVRPIFQDHCVSCHGSDEQNGGLRLDARSTVFAEADSGSRAVVAGDTKSSELLVRVLSTSDDDQMPPDGERLTADQIDVLKRWVNAGADWPEDSSHDAVDPFVTNHWSFQPIRKPAVPDVNDKNWARGAIDRFVQAKREQQSLAVSGDAEPVTFIRRVSYDLTGLPPTRDEVFRFVEQAEGVGMDIAVAGLVNELLSRSTYGERWGRHWMDWVRYADTAGDNSDFPIPEAYLYRNYIIGSLNSDVPYNQFITEQLAGDLLPANGQEDRNRKAIATGYLAMARRFGSLVERYPWHLTIEDTIDNVGRTMMGLTIACARCHDHKFDPISARDYYGLYGIFESTRYPFPGIELFQTQRDFVPLIADAEVQAKLGPQSDKTNRLVNDLNQRLSECEDQAEHNAAMERSVSIDEQRKLQEKLDDMLIKARNAGNALADHLRGLPELPVAYAVRDSKPTDTRLQIKGEPTRPGATVPRGFPKALGGQRLEAGVADKTSGRRELASWITDVKNPLTARVIVNRVWQRHFGTGIVASTSDFGLRGDLPSHPELLDWLATDFIESGWSLKHLHRRILNSRTYRLSSDDVESNLSSDPANRWLWKANRQRLDAESIRDTLLVLSGQLDPAPQTKPHPFPPKKDWEYTQHHPFKDAYPSDKRSVYMMTKRLTAQSYFQTFDGPDPNVCTGNRDQSITALQALYFVNDEFLHQQASKFAERLPNDLPDDSKLVQAFETILCRSPNADEVALMRRHVESVRGADDADAVAWASLTRSLFRLNEFMYVD